MNDDWTPPHSHDPNPTPPTSDTTLTFFALGRSLRLTPEMLLTFPQVEVADCIIASTGHEASGPFTFGGVACLDLLERLAEDGWSAADFISADDYRARITAGELRAAGERPILLALRIDGRPLTRAEGLVRLIVPGESGDALRQVKWIAEVRVLR